MARKLAKTVIVDGVTHLAGSEPPADVAGKITNEKAWADEPKVKAKPDSGDKSTEK